MSKKEGEKDFGYLGPDYQKRLIAQFVLDYKFANNIMDIVDPNYFSDQYLRMIVAEIKESHEKSEVIPDINSIGFRIADKNKNKLVNQFIGAQLDEIKTLTLNDSDEIQNMGMKFCQQQELRKSISEMQNIIDNGNLNDYDKCEDILKKALDVGADKDDGMDIFSNLELVLAEDFRKPIATGIVGLDAKMNGGLSKGELGVILAPFGVGKTTMITKLANSAFNNGYKVLQIFFEDTPKIIQRKHLACWTEIEINELGNPDNREQINTLVKEKSDANGYLMLKKFPSDGTTMPMIKQYVRKLKSSGRKPDIILLDYIDCVAPSKNDGNQSEWNAEGVIMRQFETLLTEFDMAGWTAIQGNRSSISAGDVDSSMLGGSIKKGQIAHFLVSIAKSLEQKETGRANMAILKSRFGIDGIIFSDILFDNARIQIDVDSGAGQTVTETQINKEEDNAARMIEIMSELTKKKKTLAIEENNEAPKKTNDKKEKE
jgi:replicative DNA helicase